MTMLDLVRERDARAREHVLGLLAPALREQLEGALTIAWIPIAVDIAVVEAVESVLGRATLHLLNVARQERELGSPLFRSFVSGALAIAGASPAFVVRRIPAGWSLLFRECGRFEVDAEAPSWVRLAIHDLPRECLASESWMSCIPVAFGATVALVHRAGRGALEVRHGTALVTVSWT